MHKNNDFIYFDSIVLFYLIKCICGTVSSSLYYRSYYFSEGICDPSFRELIMMMTFSSAYLISIIFLFKPMIETGKESNNSRESFKYMFTYDELTGDNFLILVDAFANFLCGIFRIIWGYFVDYFGFKTCYTIIVSIEIILIIITLMIGTEELPYWNVINILASYILIGGHFAIFPAVFSKIFGNKLGSLLYSLSFISYALSAIISLIMYIICNTIHNIMSDEERSKHSILYICCLIMCYLSLVPMGKFKSEFKYRVHEECM